MTPHADLPESPNGIHANDPTIFANGAPHSNGLTNGTFSQRKQKLGSHLQATPEDELHDLICVGFGPASLAIAVALHDALDLDNDSLRTTRPKVAFLERQEQFGWHAGMQIPGAKMQISFVKDLATLRDPRSEFTFLNYLHRNDRLVQFTNLGTFLPRRIEYEDYMRWCASHFDDVVSYGQDVLSVDAICKSSDGPAAGFSVSSRDAKTGEVITRRARNVAIAAGGRPKIPSLLPQNDPRVIHSSQYKISDSPVLADSQRPLRIAVIGSGQSAAEIFNDIPSRFPNSTSYLLIRDTALRPSDDSPFVNEIFDPDRTDDIFVRDPGERQEMIKTDKPTNYGVVRLELLEHIYDEMYVQRLKYGSAESHWPRRILPRRNVTSAKELSDKSGGLRLSLEDTSKGRQSASTEILDVDLVFMAAGYERDIHESMLQNCRHLMPRSNSSQSTKQKWTVQRDYRVDFEPGTVAADAGVWLQGCNEGTHGLSDTLLSILSVRGGEMVNSIFGRS